MGLLTPGAHLPALGELAVMRPSFGEAPSVRALRTAVGVELGEFRRDVFGHHTVDGSAGRIVADSRSLAWRRDLRVARRLRGIERDILGAAHAPDVTRTAESAAAPETASVPMSISVRQLRGRDEILGHAEAIADRATMLRGKTWAPVGMSIFIPIVVIGTLRSADALNGGDGLVTSWEEVATDLAGMFLMWNPATTLTQVGLIGSPQRHYEHVCQRMTADRLDWDYVGRNFNIQEGMAHAAGVGSALTDFQQALFAPLGPTLRWIFQKLGDIDTAWLGIDRLLRLDPETREPVLTVVVRTALQPPQYPVTQRARLGERLRSLGRQPLRVTAE